MPSIQYEKPTTTPSFASSVSSKSDNGSKSKAKKISSLLITLLVTVGAYFVSIVISGVVSAFSSNISVDGLAIVFDPQITIAYILTYYFLSHFYNLTAKQMYYFFLLSLLLSFTTSFIQGAILLVILPLALRRFHILESKQA